MARDSSPSQHPDGSANVEIELLQLLLETQASYPWNPAEPGTEQFYGRLELELAAAGWSDEDLKAPAQALALQLEQLWEIQSATATSVSPVLETLYDDLSSQLESRVPSPFLQQIIDKAQLLLLSQRSMIDQLVQCVEDVLPDWSAEDLQVLARPYAFAMRDGEPEVLEAALRSIRCAAWTELSGIEQARLSLAIARYAIAHLPSPQPEA